MKKIVISIMLTVCLYSCFAQTDSALYNSYIKVFDKNIQSLDPIEGMWTLDIKTNDVSKKVSNLVSENHFTVAIYKADKYFVVKYMSKDFHNMERFIRLDESSKLMYDRLEEGIETRTKLEGAKIVCTYMFTENKRTQEETRVFTKQYPQASTTKDQN